MNEIADKKESEILGRVARAWISRWVVQDEWFEPTDGNSKLVKPSLIILKWIVPTIYRKLKKYQLSDLPKRR